MGVQIERTYDVRIWATEMYVGTKVTTHRVIWVVAGRRWKQGHRTKAAAESFRSELMTAVRKGEAFSIATGRPMAMSRRETPGTTWYDFACQYVDMKWGSASAAYRKSIAEALTTATLPLIATDRGRPGDAILRSAVGTWGFNCRLRDSSDRPPQVVAALTWLSENTRPVADLAEPAVIRATLDALTLNLDGSRAAGTTVARKRAVVSNALSYAVELNLLTANPIGSIAWRSPKTSRVVDRRSVVNLMQARMLLKTVEQTKRSGPRLAAFFAVMYYAGLRPEEAVNLRISNLQLPTDGGRGWIVLDRSAPDVGRTWTDSGTQRDDRQLKHRAVGEVRTVPSSPVLTFLLQRHIQQFGTDAAGRLFVGVHGDPLDAHVYTKVWDRARKALFTPAFYASPLARRPYDLRHAAVSTWLNSGVTAPQVAEWAGHSVAVLLEIYAKCIDGQQEAALRRLDEAAGEW